MSRRSRHRNRHSRHDLPVGRRRRVPDYLDEVRRIIARDGHVVQIVLPNHDREAGWAYTVGLHGHGLPELIVVGGLSVPCQHSLLNEVAQRMKIGEPFVPGQRERDLLVGAEVMFVEVADTTTEDFTVANRLQDNFRALQIVWPDHSHRFPWESDYELAAWHQRVLGLPPAAPNVLH